MIEREGDLRTRIQRWIKECRNDIGPETNPRAQALAEWRTGQVKLRGFAKPFPLAKIQLDPTTGRGSYSLPNP